MRRCFHAYFYLPGCTLAEHEASLALTYWLLFRYTIDAIGGAALTKQISLPKIYRIGLTVDIRQILSSATVLQQFNKA